MTRCRYFSAHARVVLVLAVLIFPLSGCDKAAGVAAVKELCAKDGGETIYESTFVAGYLASEHFANCIECKGALSRKQFDHIDVFVEAGGGKGSIVGPGYYRYFISSVGDPRCDVWEKDPLFLQTKASWGFRKDQCLAVEPITTGISNFSWTRVQKTVSGPDGIEIESDEFSVFQIEPYRVLARHQDYAFTSRMTKFFGSIAAGGANPDVRCNGTVPWVDSPGLLQRALRDESKKSDQSQKELL